MASKSKLVYIAAHFLPHSGSILDSQPRIWQVSACKMEPRSGIISWFGPPPTHRQLSFFCKCCAVSPPQQSMCGVPLSQYMLSFKVERCPHPICSTHQECTGCPTKKFTFFKPVYLRPLISLRKSLVLEMNLWISSFKNTNS